VKTGFRARDRRFACPAERIPVLVEKYSQILAYMKLIKFLFFLCSFSPILLCSNINFVDGPFKMKNYLYDSDHVRYQLYQTNEGEPYNWLFFPGGPGADSSYLRSLVDELNLPGNVWLIDLPGNGSNVVEGYSEDFDSWVSLFPKIIEQFDHPILVGHSFGGMFPLLFPELENKLKGFIILNSAPALWLEEAVAYSKQFDLPDLSKEMQEFTLNPNLETFKAALDACMPYYFPEATLEKGRELLAGVDFQYQPAVWWQRKAIELNFSAKWVPQKVPTLIIGSKYDCICPFTLFQKDKRFQRSNIEMLFIEDAGHMTWVENPAKTKEAFEKMILRLE
jgi:pimeloyl-ACP methyl ester carboxylesterase